MRRSLYRLNGHWRRGRSLVGTTVCGHHEVMSEDGRMAYAKQVGQKLLSTAVEKAQRELREIVDYTR